MHITENDFRDRLYEDHKDTLSSLIVGRKEPVSLAGSSFPSVRVLLQHRVESRINEILSDLENVVLTAKELPLKKAGDATTRVDLFGESEGVGLVIVELKKSKQTERQAFTELLAYANHFTSIFPGLKESTITSLLIAPMTTRTARDAFVQELLSNEKNILALKPEMDGENISLSVYYPDPSYYQWFENNLFDDRAMVTIAISFPELSGWIDTDLDSGSSSIPRHSESALNAISSSISHTLESRGLHSLVYASQKWGEIAQLFPYPNTIFVVSINPFAAFRAEIEDNVVLGESETGRQEEVQAIYDCLHQDDKEGWLERMESNFRSSLIRIVQNEFRRCFCNSDGATIETEISLPDWYGIKTSLLDSVYTHNSNTYLTGLLREIYITYINHTYSSEDECMFYGDDLPKYSYATYREFLPIWGILQGIGIGEEKN